MWAHVVFAAVARYHQGMRHALTVLFAVVGSDLAIAGPDAFLKDITQLSVGHGHVCAVTTDLAVVCWGDNAVGQLGVGTDGRSAPGERARPHIVGGLPKIARVAAGSMHTCALSVDGDVWCWGHAGADLKATPGGTTGSVELQHATLGAPVKMPLGDGKAQAIGLGPKSNDACAAFATEVRCWTHFRAIPLGAKTIAAPKLRTVTLANASALALGHGKICAVTPKALQCWRDGISPSPAVWKRGDAIVPAQVAIHEMYACVAAISGQARCWWSLIDDFWKRPPEKTIPWPVRSIAVGDSPVCTADMRGAVDCFLSDEGGLPDQAIEASWAPTKLQRHRISGIDNAVEVGVGNGRNAFGYGFGCARRDKPDAKGAQVFCWGDNEHGQLGTGDRKPSKKALPVLSPQ